MMFQQPRLLPWKRTRDNIALGLKATGQPRDIRHAKAMALALRMGLTEDDLDKYPSALSGGMQSRVALARALAVQPDLLLLDEPSRPSNIGLKSELYNLLAEERQTRACAVLMITHDLMEAAWPTASTWSWPAARDASSPSTASIRRSPNATNPGYSPGPPNSSAGRTSAPPSPCRNCHE